MQKLAVRRIDIGFVDAPRARGTVLDSHWFNKAGTTCTWSWPTVRNSEKTAPISKRFDKPTAQSQWHERQTARLPVRILSAVSSAIRRASRQTRRLQEPVYQWREEKRCRSKASKKNRQRSHSSYSEDCDDLDEKEQLEKLCEKRANEALISLEELDKLTTPHSLSKCRVKMFTSGTELTIGNLFLQMESYFVAARCHRSTLVCIMLQRIDQKYFNKWKRTFTFRMSTSAIKASKYSASTSPVCACSSFRAFTSAATRTSTSSSTEVYF